MHVQACNSSPTCSMQTGELRLILLRWRTSAGAGSR